MRINMREIRWALQRMSRIIRIWKKLDHADRIFLLNKFKSEHYAKRFNPDLGHVCTASDSGKHEPAEPVAAAPQRCTHFHPQFGQCVYDEHKGDHYYARPAEG